MQDRSTHFEWKGKKRGFDEEKHVHTLDDKFLTGVTTLKDDTLAKKMLYNWFQTEPLSVLGWYNPKQAKRREETKEEFAVRLKELETKRYDVFYRIKRVMAYQDYIALLDEARGACDRKKDKGADWGSKVHDACEVYCKTGELPLESEDIYRSVKNFANFLEVEGYEVVLCEQMVHSEEWFVGGIFDLILRHKATGKLVLADIKTSSGIFPDMFLQCGAYDKMQYEMELLPTLGLAEENRYADEYLIINLKKDHTIDHMSNALTKTCRDTYDALVKVYRGYAVIQEAFNNY